MHPRPIPDLIAHYKRLARRLADETLTEREAEAVRVEMAKVQAEIDATEKSESLETFL